MVTIAHGSGLITLVVVFTTTPEEQGELDEHLVRTAHDHSRHDGFVSCSIHRSTDGSRIVEYIQWRSMAHLQAMVASPEGQAHVKGRGGQGDMHVVEVSAVIEADPA